MTQAAQHATWPVGDGDMARVIREHDWAATSLGPIVAWPPCLRAAVDICLGSAVASYVWWGSDLIQLYNDAALAINRAKHPAFLGKPAREAWVDVWDEIGGLLEHVVTTGESVRGDNLPMVPDRNGSHEMAWFTFSYGPARDETGAVAGVFCSAIETTDNVRAQQALLATEARQSFLLRLSDALRPISDPVKIQEEASRLLGEQLGADRVMYGAAVDNDLFVIQRAYRRDEDMPTPVGQHCFDDYGEYVASEFRAGRALMVTDVFKDPQYTERELEHYAGLGIRAYIAVPLVKDGHIVAFLAVNQATPRVWTGANLELVQETAERTWAAVERAPAEQALRLSEERYRTLFESMEQGFCIIEKVQGEADQLSDFRYLMANPAFAHHTGIGGVTGKTILELIPNHDERIMAHYDAVVQTGQTIHFEDHVAALDLWIEAEAYPGQSPGQVAVLFSNVGNRKRAEAALHQSEERYRTLFESMEQGFCIIEKVKGEAGQPSDFRYLVTNPAFARHTAMVGVTGKTIRQLIPDIEDRILAHYDAVVETGQIIRFEDHVAAIDLWLEAEAWPGQSPGQVAVLFSNIGNRKRSEAALRASVKRFRALVVATSYATYQMSPDWSEMRQLDGHGFMVDTGGPTTAWLGTYSNSPHQLAVTEEYEEAVRSKGLFELEHRMRRVDGTLGWTLSRAAPLLDEHGEITEWIGTASDITERKEVEAALRQSEKRYRTLFESIDQGFCTIEVLFDASGQAVDYLVLETNPAFVRNTGLVDAVGKWMRELAPAHEDHWYETYGRVALTGISARFENEAAALGRWYNVYAYRIGEPAQHRVAVLFEDITARKAAEATVRASEERFQTLVQNIVDYAIFMLDADGLVTEWPEGAQSVKGYAPEEVIGQHVSMFYPPEELAVGNPALELAEAANTGRAEREGWRLRKGGQRFWGNEIATAIRNDAGQLVGFTKIVRDLTERRKAEDALQEREELYRLIIDEATDYAILSTNAEDRIETWSPGAAAIFGWTAEEAVGQLSEITFTPEDRDTGVLAQELATARDQGRAPDIRWHVSKDGSRVFIEGTSYALSGPDNEFRGLFKIGQDVTERRLVRQRQQDDEEGIRQELARRVAEATTELRILSRRLLEVQEEERRHLALELHDDFGQMLTGLGLTLGAGDLNSARLAEAQRIVVELTERIRERSMELRPATLDSYGLLPALRWHLERYQRQTGITAELLQEGVDRRFGASVEITAYRIVQEALTNVARHSESKQATVQLFADDVALTVSVRDHGKGFGIESKNGGSGMAGMRERAELLGGTLEIDTAPGAGVTLTAELPLEVPTVGEAIKEEA